MSQEIKRNVPQGIEINGLNGQKQLTEREIRTRTRELVNNAGVSIHLTQLTMEQSDKNTDGDRLKAVRDELFNMLTPLQQKLILEGKHSATYHPNRNGNGIQQ